MEVLVIITAFWLMLVGLYGGYSLVNRSRRLRSASARPDLQPAEAPPVPAAARPLPPPAVYNEVAILRAQVEHLRSEVVALSGDTPRPERPRIRRYRTGAYTDLPRSLRRQVRQVRSVRHTVRS